MKVNKKKWQKYPKNINRLTGEYDIKTFSGYQRTRSPIEASSQNMRRSPIRPYEGTSESALGEMFYLEPNEINFRRGQNMSPLNDSQNINMRSPNEAMGNEYGSGGVINMENRLKYSKNPRFQMNSEEYLDRARSPKIINVGESPQEMDYNIKTFNRKLNNINSPQNYNMGDRSYNMMLNDTGNIFLDQPMQQAYNQSNDIFNSSSGMLQQGINEPRLFEQNNREFQFGMNPRDLQEPIHGVLRKMSPKGNVEGDSDSNSEKMDNVNQIRDLKTQLDKNMHSMYKNEDGIAYGDMHNRGDMENIEIMAKTREFQENTTGEEVKKLIKYYVKTYNPHKGEDGNLISNSQTVILSNQDQLFNNRYKVLQKMNKLSNILLSKNRNGSHDSGSLNRSFGEEGKNKFDKGTFNKTSIMEGKRRTDKSIRKNRFLYVSLAMLSAKGPNTEDRTILRKMRLDKGGVVDLAQETIQKKSKFKIKKARAGGRGITTINPKYREKAARIVQAWWRERKEKYKKILEQIIKIQSVWRGKFTRKYIYDVIYISYLQEKFLSIMRNVLVNHIRPYVFGEMFSKNKMIKDNLGDLLERYDKRFTLLRIKPYFLKWKNNADLLKNRILKSRELFNKKEKKENKLTLIKKYFDKWATLSNLYKYIGKAKNAEEKRQKFFGTINIVNGLTSLSKRQIFKNTKEPICNYLKDLLKQKMLIKIIKKICKRCLQLKLKNYLSNWLLAANKKKLNDFKKQVFLNIANHMDSRLDKIKLKYYLDKWKKHIPKAKKLFEIKEGGDLLKNFVLRNTFKYPLNALAQKNNANNDIEVLLKIIKIKRTNLKDKLRDYFNKWRNNKKRLDDKDKRNDMYQTLLKNLINKINMRILYKRFNQWRTKPTVDAKDEMKKINYFTNKLHNIFKRHYDNDYKTFLDKLNKTRDGHVLNNAAKKLFKICNNKRRIILRYYLFKWRSQIKNDELNELHRQLLRYIITLLNSKNNRNELGKYFTRWRLFVGNNKNYDNLEKLKMVLKGGDLIDNLHKRRLRDLINRLYKKLGKDYRPKILSNLLKNLNKPHSTVRECFDRWRRINDKDKSVANITKFKAKIFNINLDAVRKRNNRDKLMRAFYRWRAMSKLPEDYYPKMNNLLLSILDYIKKKATRDPFDKIKMTLNPTRYLLKLIKIKENHEKRLSNGKLRNLLGRWRKMASDINNKNLRAKILYNVKIYLDDSQKKKLLSKYFTKWRLNTRKKGLDVNFVKAIDKLNQIFKAPLKPLIFGTFIKKIKIVDKNNAINGLLKALNKHQNNILHKKFLNWWKKAMTTDPNKNTKIKTKIRKIIKYNEMEPRTKAFRKWVKFVQLSQLRDKDINHAAKILEGVLRNKDKIDVYNAFNNWRFRIYKLREQYLKALLLKQIKTAQTVKEKMSNEARLRTALLKWRRNIISMNYLDTIKQIRRGCKLFKLGLKKMHEKDILDKIKENGKIHRKKIILKKTIIKLVPNLEKQKLKRAFDIWKNKLGDTQKMKDKIKNLFDDYIYADTVHQGLFKNPKQDIINLLKNIYDDKNNKIQKITKFVGGILKIKESIRTMKRNKLLFNILKKKNAYINDIKRIQFIRFYRQVQKDKNDEAATIIQNFIKKLLRKKLNKKQLIKDGLDKFNLFLKRKIFNNIKDNSKEKYITIVLKKSIIKKKDNSNDILREKFNEWKNKIPQLKKLEAVNKIQNAYRTHLANEKLKKYKLRNIILIKIYENNDNKNKTKLMVLLRDWLHRAIKTKNNEAAKTIQRLFRKRLEQNKNKNANDKLKNMFKNYVKHNLANIMKRVSRVLGGKGEVVYKALQDILYRNPFNKFINDLKLRGKVNKLKQVQPKIHEKIKNYYLSKALQKWKENTYEQTVKHIIMLQKFLRDQYEKKMKKDKERRELLLLEIVNKKIKNNTFKLKLPFNIWHKKVILEKMNEAAIKIQNNYRNYIARNKANDLKTSAKYFRLINNLKKKQLIDILKKIKDNKELKDKRKKILTIILSKKIIFNDNTSLADCFNKWKRINEKVKDSASRIANAFRSYKARKEKDRLKNINILIKKYILKHIKKDDDNKRAKLRKWNKMNNLIKLNESIIKIQKFMIPKLAKIRNDKLKEYFNDNARKKIYKYLLLSAKLNRLQNALIKPRLTRFSSNLKTIKRDKNRNDVLNKTLDKRNEKIKIIILKKYIQKWKDQNKTIGDKTNDSASVIQRAFKGYKARKKRDRLLTKKKVLFNFILKKDKNIHNKLYSTLRKWIYIVRTLKCQENAKIIQKNWRKFQDKIKKDKELAKKLKIKNGLEKLFNIKFGGKKALEKIISERNRNIFKKFNDTLKNKRLDNLKDCFDKIKERRVENVLKKLIKIPEAFKKRIIKKTIFTLKDKGDKLGKKRSVDTIIKNWKIYLDNKKQKNKKVLLNKILSNIITKNSDALRRCFKKWYDIAIKKRDNYVKQRIGRFLQYLYKISNIRKKWRNLINKYSIKNRNEKIFDIINRLKQMKLLNKFKKPIVDIARKKLFDKLKNNKKKTTIYFKYTELIPKREEKNNNDILKKYFLKWKNNVTKINNRDNLLNTALDNIIKRQTISDANNITRIMIIKKLFHDIPFVRAKSFFQRIKDITDRKNKYTNLEENIIKSKNDLDNQKKKKFLNKIYKLFVYNKINDFLNACQKYDGRIKNIYGKELFNKLIRIKSDNSTYNYNNNQQSSNQAKIIKMKFKSKTKEKEKVFTEQNAPMKKVLPSLVNYLNKLIKRRKEDTFDIIKSELISRNFDKLFKKFNDRILKDNKKEFVNKIKRDAKYSKTRPAYQVKLFKLFRKKYIKIIRTTLIKPSRIYKLFYFINLVTMHKNIAAQRYYREIIRKWRFVTFTKKMARKKLELMYKNMHASYLQMADEIFGEDKVNPSVFKEFERFGSNVGMFTGQEPEIDEELGKKYYSNIDKKYVFTKRASGIISDAQDLKKEEYIEEMKERYEEEEKKEMEKNIMPQSTKNINRRFDSIRKSGLSKKYFGK